MNIVNIPTILDAKESARLRFKIQTRTFDYLRDAVLTHMGDVGEVLANADGVPAEFCYDPRGNVLIRLTLDKPECMLEDIRESCPVAMKAAEAESTEKNVQYPNVAFNGVDFVTVDKIDIEALCEKIDALCAKAGYKDLDGLSSDPMFGDFCLAFARLFDREGGFIYNNGHKVYPSHAKEEEFKISPEALSMSDDAMKDLSEGKEPVELDLDGLQFSDEEFEDEKEVNP